MRHHIDEVFFFVLVALNLPESAVLILVLTFSLWALDSLFGISIPGGLLFLMITWLAFTGLGSRRHLRAWQRERAELA